VKDLARVRKGNPRQRFLGGPGQVSSRVKIVGDAGQDVEVRAPLGVSVVTDEGRSLGEIVHQEDRVLVAAGGQGGNKATDFMGLRGQARSVRLDLKLLADVGLVGFPNAGKSTLLKAVSRARPKIASYPFTTIRPNLGVMEFPDLRRITIADLPGLIEGASYNIGMGHRFLKHVERTRLLMFVVDLAGFQFKPDSPHRSALDTLLLLNKELELYQPDLLARPAVLVLTKMDLPGAEERRQDLLEGWRQVQDLGPQASGLPADLLPSSLATISEVLSVSAKFAASSSVAEVQARLRHWIDEHEAKSEEGGRPAPQHPPAEIIY